MASPIQITRRGTLALAAGLAGLSLSDSAEAAPTRGGKLIYGRYGDSLFLDPVLNDANFDIWVMNSIYDTLILPSADGMSIQPGLATKWMFGEGGRSLTLTLRAGVKFSDGAPMLASDVKWSLDRARDPKNGAWNNLIASIDAVEVAGADSIVLKLKRPDPTLLAALATFNTGILPQKQFEATAGATMDEKAKTFAERPIGTGPFMVTEWRRGQVMRLARNPHHWKQGEDGKPLPYLDEIEFQIIPDDATRVLKLKAGELHGIEFVPFVRVKELQADPNLRMELWPSTRVAYIGMMVKPTLHTGAANPLANQKVRQALNHAVNRDAIIAITTHGLGKKMHSFMSSTTPLFHGPAPLWPYDLAKAKALLAEAGFPNGFEVTCMLAAGNQDNLNNVTALQQMWSQIGVTMKIEQMDSPSVTKRYRAEEFQLRTGGWTNDIADPGQITSYFAYTPTINALRSGYEDKEVNALFLRGQEETDLDKRRAIYRELQDRFNAAATIVPLYETPYPVAFRKNVKGFSQIPLGNNYFDGTYIEK